MPRNFEQEFNNMTTEQYAEMVSLIERQAAQIKMMREALDKIIYDIESNLFSKAQKKAIDALTTTPEQALEQFAAKVRRQCIEACRYTGCGIVGNMLSEAAIAKIRAIKDLP